MALQCHISIAPKNINFKRKADYLAMDNEHLAHA